MADLKAQWPSECRGADVLANCFRVFQKRKSHEPKRHPRCFFCRIATGASGNATRHAEIYRGFAADQRGVGAVRLYQARSAGQSTWRTPQHGLDNSQNKHKLGRLSAKTTQRILANPDTPPSCALSFKNIWPKDRLAKLLVCASCAIQGSQGHQVRLQKVEGQRGAGRVMPPTKPVPAHPTPSVLRRHI